MVKNKAKGGFHDVASFRAELGADANAYTDDMIRQILNESRQEAKRTGTNINEWQAYDYGNQVNELKSEINQLKSIKNNFDSELDNLRKFRNEIELEKARKSFNEMYLFKSPSSISDYLGKEKLKKEVKDELIQERKEKARERELAKLWANVDKPKRSPRSKSKKKKSKKSPKRKSKSVKKK
jgi:hypothetical protein